MNINMWEIYYKVETYKYYEKCIQRLKKTEW